ncbi:hypothetical protein PIB30_020588 [Stylosanthes scabra]|uniref:MATH domain-containing protein n=1 Tax=Stylosanthes scabra TaxID=79078 RepID=A0ABU6Q8N9_9FABA|nr:hypothetical protein [Stylosanthes scabra]
MEQEIKGGANFKYTWTVKNFSKLTPGDMHYSGTFSIFPYTWHPGICPNSTTSLLMSVHLFADDIDHFYVDDQRISANVKLSLVNQLETNSTITKDFKGLCSIRKKYAEVLEESCSKHPSLIECHKNRKRSERFNEYSFTALGKLLHFFKTKKVKDMKSDDSCMELQDLWDEVETRFDDLGWLEPHVQSALTYFDKAAKVQKLKVDVTSLKEKLKTLNADLETRENELAKAEEGFVERNLDDQLGVEYPKS